MYSGILEKDGTSVSGPSFLAALYHGGSAKWSQVLDKIRHSAHNNLTRTAGDLSTGYSNRNGGAVSGRLLSQTNIFTKFTRTREPPSVLL